MLDTFACKLLTNLRDQHPTVCCNYSVPVVIVADTANDWRLPHTAGKPIHHRSYVVAPRVVSLGHALGLVAAQHRHLERSNSGR